MANLALSIRKQGRLGEAEALQREVLEIRRRVLGRDHPATLKTARSLANLCTNEAWRLATTADLEQLNPKQAVQLARDATQLQPDNANHWNNLGVALYRDGQFEEAAESLRKADEMITGGDREHRMFYAMALWQLGREEEARGRYAQGVAWIQAVKASSPQQKRFREEAETLMGLDSDDREQLISEYFAGKLSSKPSAKDLTDHGELLRTRGRNEEAIESFSKAIRNDPENARAFGRRAFAYCIAREWKLAIADCDRAIELNPNDAYAYGDRALAWNALGQYDSAIADCSEAIRLAPDWYWGFERRSNSHRLKGEFEQAARDARKAMELDPKLPNAYTQLAWALIASQQWDEASHCFEQLVELDPKNIGYLKNLARCEFMAQGREAYQNRCRSALANIITPEAGVQLKRHFVDMCCSVANAVDDTRAMVLLAQDVIADNPPNAVWNKKVLAKALLSNGQIDEALPLLLELVVDESDQVGGQTMFLLAKAYHAADQPELAKDWLHKGDAWTNEYLAKGEWGFPVYPLTVRVAQKDAHEFLATPPRESDETADARSKEVATSSD
jgi:tetratricopeptide (TPR) repeat protein